LRWWGANTAAKSELRLERSIVPDLSVDAGKASSLSKWLPKNNAYYAALFTHPATQVTYNNFFGPESGSFTLQSNNGTTIVLSADDFGNTLPQTHYYLYLLYVYYDGSGNQCYANGPIGDFTTQ
jgi:hypothetical protein